VSSRETKDRASPGRSKSNARRQLEDHGEISNAPGDVEVSGGARRRAEWYDKEKKTSVVERGMPERRQSVLGKIPIRMLTRLWS